MQHFAVRTLTLNPSIDVSSEADKVEPEKKIRTCCERIDPGGGGINVARVLKRFGIAVEAVFLAGGATGHGFDALLERAGLARRWVQIEDDTRTSLTVHERSTGNEYRFVPEGPTITKGDLLACREALLAATSDYLVASGSLPPGVPDDFYGSLGAAARERGTRYILDTSGAELEAAIQAGNIYLLKASKEELDRDAATTIVRDGKAELVALTLGSEGALLVTRDGAYFLPTFDVETVSTVGAGDSFLGGFTYALASGKEPLESFRIAVASGAAATLSPGTDLAYPAQVEALLPRVAEPELR